MPGHTSQRTSVVEVKLGSSADKCGPSSDTADQDDSDNSECADAMKKPVSCYSVDDSVKSFHIGDTDQSPTGIGDAEEEKTGDWWFSSDDLTETILNPQVVTRQITTSTPLSMCDESDEEEGEFELDDPTGRWLNGNVEVKFLSKVDEYTKQVAALTAAILPAAQEHTRYSKRISSSKVQKNMQRDQIVERNIMQKHNELFDGVNLRILPLFDIDNKLHRILNSKFWSNMAEDSVEHRITKIYGPIRESWALLAPYFVYISPADQNSATGTSEFPSGTFLSSKFVRPTPTCRYHYLTNAKR